MTPEEFKGLQVDDCVRYKAGIQDYGVGIVINAPALIGSNKHSYSGIFRFVIDGKMRDLTLFEASAAWIEKIPDSMFLNQSDEDIIEFVLSLGDTPEKLIQELNKLICTPNMSEVDVDVLATVRDTLVWNSIPKNRRKHEGDHPGKRISTTHSTGSGGRTDSSEPSSPPVQVG